MRRDLICVAKESKVYVFNASTPFTPIDEIKEINDVVEALISQRINYTAMEISDSEELLNGTILYNINGASGKSHERNLYFYNLNDHRVVFSFLNKFVSKSGVRELCYDFEDGNRFEVSCPKKGKKHYKLIVVHCCNDVFDSFCYDEI